MLQNNYKFLFLYSLFFIEEDEDDKVLMPGVGPIAMHASNRDDPLLEIQDDVSFSFIFEFDKYDPFRVKIPMLKIILFDPMIILLLLHILKMILLVLKYMVNFMYRNKFQFSNENILVYNDKEGYLYVHHDILMLNMPLCLTWLDYDVNDANAGLDRKDNEIFIVIFIVMFLVNYVAVGSMEGVIELFDIDLVDQMEPLHTFGKKSKKKKTKLSKKNSKVCLKKKEIHLIENKIFFVFFFYRKQIINQVKVMILQYLI
jgi:hypothetical protein